MNTKLFLSAAAALGIMSGAAFAQTADIVTLKPGQTVNTAGQAQLGATGYTPQSADNSGVVSLKPGETAPGAAPADLGSPQPQATGTNG